MECCICLNILPCIKFLPCKHHNFCLKCAINLFLEHPNFNCPLCRSQVKYFSINDNKYLKKEMAMLLLCLYYSIDNEGRFKTFIELVPLFEDKINSSITNHKRYALTKALQYIRLKYNRFLSFRNQMNMYFNNPPPHDLK